jgi:hypothetical protein
MPTPSPSPTSQPVQRQVTSEKTDSQTVDATGQGQTQGTHATGTINIDDLYGKTFHFPAGTILNNTSGCATGIEVTLDSAVDLTRAGDVTDISVTVVQPGTAGNVQDCPGNFAFRHCSDGLCNQSEDWVAYDNNGGFSGGTYPQAYTYVQQSDIDNAASTLTSSTTEEALAGIQSQLQSNEHIVGNPQCTSTTSADQKAGDRASSVTVEVTTNCVATVST